MEGKFGKWGQANNGSLVFADLGPTNTGKTHRALQRMLELKRGIIGLPLRLLAREVYERLVRETRLEDVALITGEERIIPNRPSFYVCTVESMPSDITVPIVVVDEIQLATHPKRGHIFTDRILNARGTVETWFLGSDTMQEVLETLIPTIEIHASKRLSPLRYIQPKRLSALPKRTAIVSFNITHLYELAERMRLAKGGVAIVMGAMSPQSRNAQVELFQSGKVDTLIATDAIGLGLNLDIRHVCFASTRKFDGQDYRHLTLAEMGQIAGRAGRFKQGGSFNLSVDAAASGGLSDTAIQSIEQQIFQPVRKVYYRHDDLSFESIDHFWRSIQKRPFAPCLMPQREALDELTIRYLLKDEVIRAKVNTPATLNLLWRACRIPDYAQQSHATHFRFVRSIFLQLAENGHIDTLWLTRQFTQLQNMAGDIPQLLQNMAKIRTWNYISHRPDWIANPTHWQMQLKQLENTLSETVHQRLTERFIDELGTETEREVPRGVYVEGETLWSTKMQLGVVDALSFIPSHAAQARYGFQTVRTLGRSHFENLANETYLAILKENRWHINTEFQICYGPFTMAVLKKGTTLREPTIQMRAMDLLDARQRQQIELNLRGWWKEQMKNFFSLYAGEDLDTHDIRFEMRQNLGLLQWNKQNRPNADIRKKLAKQGIVTGKDFGYHKDLFKGKYQPVRFLLYALWNDIKVVPDLPLHRVSISVQWPKGMARALGYYTYAGQLIRGDIVDNLRWKNKAILDIQQIASTLGLSKPIAEQVWTAMGFEIPTDTASKSNAPNPSTKGAKHANRHHHGRSSRKR